MPTLSISAPNEKQKLFLQATAKHIAFGGARGGGKSWAVRTKAKLLCARYPGIRLLIVRRSYPELQENHIKILRQELIGAAKYNDKDKTLRFINGSTIRFTYCERDSDLDRLQGTEYDVIFLDEATQLSEFQMKSITACVRGTNPFPKRIYYTCNPGGVGHQYIKRLFIDKRYEGKEKPEDYIFIQSLVQDNVALMAQQPDYIEQLENLPPKLREAWLYGNWNIFEGQFFEEFKDDPTHYKDRRYTHVVEPFDIPPQWTIYRSYDFGYSKPFSAAWWAYDFDGRLYRILEYYGATATPNEGLKLTADQQFTNIANIENQHPLLKGKRIYGVADPAIWDASGGESVAETAERHHIYFEKGDHKRIAGWMQMHYRMQFDDIGIPMMYIFNTCKAFIRTIPLLQYDEHKVEDLDTTGEDHVADETRYMCMVRPIKPKVGIKKNDYTNNPLYQYLDIIPD